MPTVLLKEAPKYRVVKSGFLATQPTSSIRSRHPAACRPDLIKDALNTAQKYSMIFMQIVAVLHTMRQTTL